LRRQPTANIVPITLRRHRSIARGGRPPGSSGWSRARWSSLTVIAVVLLTGVAGLATEVASAASPVPFPSKPVPFPSKEVTFSGHGLGPGYGLGQWGAFGLAAAHHFTYQQILANYYSDTAHPVTDATLSAKADAAIVSVVVEENDNHAVTVTSPSPFTYTSSAGKTVATIPAGDAGRAVEISEHGTLTGLWEIETAASCSAKSWKTVVVSVTDPTAVPASLQATAPTKDLLTLCRADGRGVTYRGRLEAYDYHGASTGGKHLERTLSLVSIEEYVADVTPGESPSGWGTYGAAKTEPQGEPWGFQELEAQAIASRTYLLYSIASGGWYGYADICDDVCEYYSDGIAWESPLSDLAVRDTAGQYLVQNKQPAPTEYSSSDGGYTEALSYWNGQSIFDAAKDVGDSVCIVKQSLACNPWHTWSAAVSVVAIEKAFPAVGTLVSVAVTSTDRSGRVTSLAIVGEKGTASLSGVSFQEDFAFLSSMFVVTDGPGATKKADPHALSAISLGSGGPGFRPPVSPATTRMLAGDQH